MAQIVRIDPQGTPDSGGVLSKQALEARLADDLIISPIKDLCALILSRSSYGRAGLLIAAAFFVHPGWHGCLTLELENLGEVPIKLRPGSTIGQLVIMKTSPLPVIPLFKRIPTGPMFTSLRADPRWKKLQNVSKRLHSVPKS